MTSPAPQTFNTTDGCPLAYTLHPAPAPGAPRIALIHSLALDRSIWSGVVQALSDKAEVLTYDCRGHGQSGRAAVKYTCELFARDLAELLDHVGWRDTAGRIRTAVDQTLREDNIRTGDLGGKATTAEYAAAVVSRLRSNARV